MPTNTVVSVSDGSSTTVRDLVGAPTVIPHKIVEKLDNAFLSSVLLRNGGRNGNGLVSYSESDPFFLDTPVDAVPEFGEIPVGYGRRGVARVAQAAKFAQGIRVSKEMIDENRINDVTRQVTQLVNTFVRNDERALRNVLVSGGVPTVAAAAPWTGTTAKIRQDVAKARSAISSATAADTGAEDYYPFNADTIAMHTSLADVLLGNDEFLQVYAYGLAAESIAYTGVLPNRIMGLNVLTSPFLPTDRVLVCERGTIGFYSDTRPFQVTGLYPEGNGPNGGATETFRSDASRKWLAAADQPLAGRWITGVQ